MENKKENTRDDASRDKKGSRKRSYSREGRKATSGPAPRKMLGPKGRKYFYDLHYDNKIAEAQTQSYPSTSDVQVQVEKETKNAECQTDFNSRFYIERSDRMAQDPNWRPLYMADSEDDPM